MSPSDRIWFKSKLDWWLGVILVAVPLIQVAAVTSALRQGDQEALTATLVGAAVVVAIYGLLLVPIRYGIADKDLLVRFGVVRQHIAFDSILEIYPTRSPLSSAALSLDRLAIRTGRGPLQLTLISPLEREEFMSVLSRKADLTWDGRRWVRVGHDTPEG